MKRFSGYIPEDLEEPWVQVPTRGSQSERAAGCMTPAVGQSGKGTTAETVKGPRVGDREVNKPSTEGF